MPSHIDPTEPVDGVPAVRADLRTNLQSAKEEIEALQTGKADVSHQHVLGDITNSGALAGLDQVDTAEITDAAVAGTKIAADAVGAAELQDGIPIDMQGQLLTQPHSKSNSEESATPAVSTGTLTLDVETGNAFDITFTDDVTSLILANPPSAGTAGSATPLVRQDATGDRTLPSPSPVRCAGGMLPLVTPAANAINTHALKMRDCTTWFGSPGGQDFG